MTDEISACSSRGGRWIMHVPNGVSPFAGASLYDDLTHELAFTAEVADAVDSGVRLRSRACFEDEPVGAWHQERGASGVVESDARRVLRFYLAVETASAQPVLTQNMLAVAVK